MVKLIKTIKNIVNEARLAHKPSGVQSKNNLLPVHRQNVRRSPRLVNQVNSSARYNEEEVDLLKSKVMKKAKKMKTEGKENTIEGGKTATGKRASSITISPESPEIRHGHLR
jgi:hypothetical protein